MAVHVLLPLAFVLYSASAARIGSRGDFMRHREFNVSNETLGSDPEGRCRWVSMLTDRLRMYTHPPRCESQATAPPFCSSQGQVPGEFKSEGCIYDDAGHDPLVDTLDLGTVTIDDIEESEGGADGAGRFCATLKGCPSAAECRDVSFERHKWHLCVDERDTIESWLRWIDGAYLRIHDIADRLPNMIESACSDIDLPRTSASNNFSDINLPHALAPMLTCGGQGSPARGAQVRKLLGVVAAFRRGTIAFRPGKTSRSGASFFFDRTKQYLAKRIRDFEYAELWRLTNSCDYSKWVGGSASTASTLNPIFLAFYSEAEGTFWEIMRVEQLPPGIVKHMPPKASSWRSDFFYDLKPSPMTSDLGDFVAMLSRISLSAHLDMANVAPLKGVINDSLFMDFKFLHAQNLIDYSLLTYGTILREDPDDAASREFFAPGSPQRLELEAAVNAIPGCGFGCSDRSFHVVDVTSHLDSAGYVEHDGRTYKCCCTELQPGSVGALVSPCQLVDVSTKRAGWGGATAGCGSLVGYGVHNMFHDQVTRYLGGRCVVARGAPEPYLPAEAFEVLESDQGGQRIAACGLFCLSVIDYLMPFNFWHKAENVVLAPYYGDFKWSRYDERMRRLVKCLSTPPFPRASPRLQAAFHDRSRFVPTPWLMKCEKEFEVPEGFDEPVIENLRALTQGK